MEELQRRITIVEASASFGPQPPSGRRFDMLICSSLWIVKQRCDSYFSVCRERSSASTRL